MAATNWQDDDGLDIAGLSAPSMNGAFLKLTLGGGGFYYSD